MKKSAILSLVLIFALLFAACSAYDPNYGMAPGFDFSGIMNGANKGDAPADDGILADPSEEAEAMPDGTVIPGTENEFAYDVVENEYVNTLDENVSTFSADVDTASYAFFRKLVEQGYDLRSLKATAGGSFRTEEMVNYFNYNYPQPEEGKLFSVNAEIAQCPWNPDAQLLMLGLQAEKTVAAERNNLVFLIDISGSMFAEDKLPLLQKAFSHLIDNLGADDRVSIVTYAGTVRTVLNGCEGSKKDMILRAVNSLEAGGSTAGQSGIEMAYRVAEENFLPDGNNRIILASDGDFNVGISSVSELEALISQKRTELGVFLSVLGFGTGNYRDSVMETLANKGNGVYYYIDGEREAEKVMGTDIISTLYTVAKDVKLQLTFNADVIEAYRLVGYENRLLANEDFYDDTKDAGEMGAGHSVTVFYELKLKEGADAPAGELMTLGVRYKEPDEDMSKEENYSVAIDSITSAPSDNFKLATSLAAVSMYLNGSKFINEDVNLDMVYSVLSGITLDDEYKTEFASLVDTLRKK